MGEWRFDEDGEIRSYDGEDLVDDIAIVHFAEHGPLISAAPDLLKVAQEIVAASNGGGDVIRLLVELHRIAAGAVLAISKATSEGGE